MLYRCSITRLSSKQRRVSSLCSRFIIVQFPPRSCRTAAGFGPLSFSRSLCFLMLIAAADTFTATLSCSAALELLGAWVKREEEETHTSGQGCQNKIIHFFSFFIFFLFPLLIFQKGLTLLLSPGKFEQISKVILM